MTYPSFVQLAGDWRGDVPEGGLMWEEKKDGFRAARFPGLDGQPRLWTRGGLPIEGTGHILHRLDLMERAAGEPLVFDGEYQVDGTLAATKAWCERGWKQGSEAGVLHLFDVMPLREWRGGGSATPLYERKKMLAEIALSAECDPWEWRAGSRGKDDSGCVRVLADGWAFDVADVITEARRAWAAGGEGLMLKDVESTYRRNRSEAWQKVKQENFSKWRKAA